MPKLSSKEVLKRRRGHAAAAKALDDFIIANRINIGDAADLLGVPRHYISGLRNNQSSNFKVHNTVFQKIISYGGSKKQDLGLKFETLKVYQYTVSEMNEIYEMIFATPIDKEAICDKLKLGKNDY